MRRERAPIEDRTASTSAGSALRSAERDKLAGDAVEQRNARLLRQQQNILEREQACADGVEIAGAGSLDILHDLLELRLVEFVEHACDTVLARRDVLRGALDQQPRLDLLLDDLDRGLGYLGHRQHALDDFAARRLFEHQQHIGGGLRRQLGKHQRRRLRMLDGEERAEPRRLELFDRRPDRRRRGGGTAASRHPSRRSFPRETTTR